MRIAFGINLLKRGLGILPGPGRDNTQQRNLFLDLGRLEYLRELIGLGRSKFAHRLAGELSIPFTTALGAAAEALRALGAHDVLVMTPFDASMNALLTAHLSAAGFNAACAELGFSNENQALEIGPAAVFDMARGAVKAAGKIDAVYFQGAVLDPLAIIDDMERELGVPVIASNPSMLWSILSKLGRSYRIEGGGKLLAEWPAGG